MKADNINRSVTYDQFLDLSEIDFSYEEVDGCVHVSGKYGDVPAYCAKYAASGERHLEHRDATHHAIQRAIIGHLGLLP